MDDSFRVRVDKVFGSLSSAAPTPSSTLSSLWSLTDEEIERNECNREKDSPEREPNSFPLKKGFLARIPDKPDVDFRSELEKDLDDLDEDDGDQLSRGSRDKNSKPDDYNDEEWEIKNSIGLDCTLDYEEEEDEYDKVAVGKEKAGDPFCLCGIDDYGLIEDSNNELPTSFKDVARDPRANHAAAKLRLKEDADAAKKMDSLRVSEQDSLAVVDDPVKLSEDGNLKSILKRRDYESDSKTGSHQSESKSQKRVRFDPECKDSCDIESERNKDKHMETDTVDELVYPLPPDYPSGIPDYMRNPSKYTHYTFDSSSDVDEQSNRQAYTDFLKMLNKSNITESGDTCVDLPKSVTFIPKRRASDTEMIDNCIESKLNRDDPSKESMLRRALPISFAPGDTEDNEHCAMEEDETETTGDMRKNLQRSGRRYRTKASLETDESI